MRASNSLLRCNSPGCSTRAKSVSTNFGPIGSGTPRSSKSKRSPSSAKDPNSYRLMRSSPKTPRLLWTLYTPAKSESFRGPALAYLSRREDAQRRGQQLETGGGLARRLAVGRDVVRPARAHFEGASPKGAQALRRAPLPRNDCAGDAEELHKTFDVHAITIQPAVVDCRVVHADDAAETLAVCDRQLDDAQPFLASVAVEFDVKGAGVAHSLQRRRQHGQKTELLLIFGTLQPRQPARDPNARLAQKVRAVDPCNVHGARDAGRDHVACRAELAGNGQRSGEIVERAERNDSDRHAERERVGNLPHERPIAAGGDDGVELRVTVPGDDLDAAPAQRLADLLSQNRSAPRARIDD